MTFSSWHAMLLMLGLGAACAFLLGLALMLSWYALPRPRRFGAFDVDQDND